jgi:hypothetical protein
MRNSLTLKLGAGLVALSVFLSGAGPATAAPADERSTVVSLTNQARVTGGQLALIESAELNTVAQAWADEMAVSGYRHSENSWRSDRIAAGWNTHAENIAQGYRSADQVVAAWIASSGHYRNIMNEQNTRIGVGYNPSQNLWVQIFVGYPADLAAAPQPAAPQPAAPQPAAPQPAEPVAPLPATPEPAAPQEALYKIAYDSTIYEFILGANGRREAVPLSYEKWRDVYKFQTPAVAATDFVKYPWSPTVYAVTFWPGGESYWMWTPLSFQQWLTAGKPSPRNAGWIEGSYYYQWGTSPELFVEGADGVNHKLSYQEWAASGFRAHAKRSNEGYLKLSWAPEFARMLDLSTGAGRPMGYAEWEAEAFPTPRTVQRVPGDTFYSFRGSPTIWYAGPGMNRPVTLQEWQAAGSPSPRVQG